MVLNIVNRFQMNNFNMTKGGILGQGPVSVPAVAAALPDLQIPANIIQTRELLYRLIISQLFYDGYQQVAVTLSNMGRFTVLCIYNSFLSMT